MSGSAASVLAAVLAMGAVLLAAWRRATIARLRVDLVPPPVPRGVLDRVRNAEAAHYAGLAAPRRAIEALQDLAARLLPDVVAWADWSVGRYRVRPSTLARLLGWARAQGYLAWRGERVPSPRATIAHFAVRRGTDAWQAAVLLEHLRRMHPALRDRPWATVAADPMQVALLYSGYLGAGGDWDAWQADAAPGAEALRRLGLSDRAPPGE